VDDDAVAERADGSPVVEFFCLYPDTHPPEPASRDVRGSLPARAVKTCTPLTAGSAFGWYIYPPVDFALRWHGSETEWSLLDDNEPVQWRSLAGGHDGTLAIATEALAQVPEADLDIFDRYGGSIPFIDADPRGPDRVEIVTGVLARTSPGWTLLVREPPNWPRHEGVQVYEGIIETEWYRSYLPTIIRLTVQHKVVRFYRNLPIMAVQPIPVATLEAARSPAVVCRGVGEFPADVWAQFVAWRRQRQQPDYSAGYISRQRDRARRAGDIIR
jgi:hypothetical protein